jgi:hypothetical protein
MVVAALPEESMMDDIVDIELIKKRVAVLKRIRIQP